MVKIVVYGLLSILLLSHATPLFASSDNVKWVRVNIPAEGEAGNWVLASGSNIQHLTAAVDGTLYAYSEGLDYTLYRSTDGGHSWSHTGEVEDEIVAIAIAPDDAESICYATISRVFKSTDGGQQFTELAENPGGAGSDNITITDIDIAFLNGKNVIAVATRDSDKSEFGGVYILDESKPFSGWVDTGAGSHDVYAVALSPDFATDRQLVAVFTDETDTLVSSKIGTAAWGQTVGNARLLSSGNPVAVDTSAVIVFPGDYDLTNNCVHFAAIDAGNENGDVYMINGVEAPDSSVATDLDIGAGYGLSSVDVAGLAISGKTDTACLMAGAAGSAEVYTSTNGGDSWTRSTKPPTGQSGTYVAIDTNDCDQAYATTSGNGSAVSVTRDGGTTWNQTGLIDTEISTIIDFSPSPQYSQDNTLFMVTWGGGHSLWRSLDSGETWERVYATTHADVDEIDRVELPPEYGEDSKSLYIAGSSNGKPAIWKSEDNGQEFDYRGPPFPIDAWAIAGDKTVFLGSYDGTNGLVYRTDNGGLNYSSGAFAGNQSLNSIALSPEYDKDETILVGNGNGWVYWSGDNGSSFEPLPTDAPSPPLTGTITVAFDPEFGSNDTVYAASDTPDSGIYRFIMDSSDDWERIDCTLPDGGMVSQLKLATDGTLYATNLKPDGGMERCLNPTYSLGPTFETVTRGLDDGATLTGLWICDNRLWAIDTTNNRLLSYTDSLTLPVALKSPANKARGTGTINSDRISNVTLDWETLSGATDYQWQLDYDTDFSSVPDGFEGDTKASQTRLPALELATTYYWRVRATEPVPSPWSDKWLFTTSLGAETAAPELYTPEPGASGVPPIPVFQWSAIAGADGYDLLVATDPSFEDRIITKTGETALPTTAWECDTELSYETTYFWKVRATGLESHSAWSATYAFTTQSPSGMISSLPTATPPAPPPAPPPAADDTDWTKWLVFLGGALLIVMAATLITMIVLVTRMRRP